MFSHYHNYAAGPLWPAHSLSHFVHQHYMRNGCSVWGFKSNPAWMLCVIFRIPILGFTCLFFGRWQKSLKNDPFTLSNWIFHPFHDLHIFLNYNPKTILTVVFVIFLWSFFLVVLIYITIFDNLRSGNIMTITQHEVFWLTHLTVSGEKQVWWNKTHFYHRQCLIEMLTKRALFASWGRVEWDWHMEMSYLTSKSGI